MSAPPPSSASSPAAFVSLADEPKRVAPVPYPGVTHSTNAAHGTTHHTVNNQSHGKASPRHPSPSKTSGHTTAPSSESGPHSAHPAPKSPRSSEHNRPNSVPPPQSSSHAPVQNQTSASMGSISFSSLDEYIIIATPGSSKGTYDYKVIPYGAKLPPITDPNTLIFRYHSPWGQADRQRFESTVDWKGVAAKIHRQHLETSPAENRNANIQVGQVILESSPPPTFSPYGNYNPQFATQNVQYAQPPVCNPSNTTQFGYPSPSPATFSSIPAAAHSAAPAASSPVPYLPSTSSPTPKVTPTPNAATSQASTAKNLGHRGIEENVESITINNTTIPLNQLTLSEGGVQTTTPPGTEENHMYLKHETRGVELQQSFYTPLPPLPSDLNPKDFMKHLTSRRLVEIIVPGSHNSLAYGDIDWSVDFRDPLAPVLLPPVKAVISKWTVNHSMTFKQQLYAGLRCFDFDIRPHKGDFYSIHRFAFHKVDQDLADLAAFLAENPSEVVIIIIITSEWTADASPKFRDLWRRYKLDTLTWKGPFNPDTTVGQAVKENKRILVYCDRDDAYPEYFFPVGLCYIPFMDTDDVDKRIEHIQQSVKNIPFYCHFSVVGWQLTPSPQTIVNVFNMSNIISLSEKIHKQPLFRRLLDRSPEGKCVNVITFDHAPKKKIDEILRANFSC